MRNFNVSKAKNLQKFLSSKVLEKDFLDIDSIRTIAAVDAAYVGDKACSCGVLQSFNNLNIIGYTIIVDQVDIPYIPGLLAFREVPIFIKTLKRLFNRFGEADIVIVNGHGIAHPRRFGIASHVGVVLDKPTIGIARHKLTGNLVVENGEEYLTLNGLKVAYRMKVKSSYIYVSVGHKITLPTAIKIIRKLTVKHTLPEPLFLADKLSKKYAKKLKKSYNSEDIAKLTKWFK